VDGTRILLPTSKNNDPKEIQLNLFALRILASLPHGEPDDLLFPDVSSPEVVSMAFHRVCKTLGISDIRLHDCRHTFATWLRQRGTELDVIAIQLGHRDLRMTKRYAKVAARQVRQAVIGLDADFATITESPLTEVTQVTTLAGKSPLQEAISPPTRSPSAAGTQAESPLKVLSD
jgi:integrase